jgi:hypothetical protein
VKISKKASLSAMVVAAIAATLVPLSLESAGASTTACGSWCTSPTNQSAVTANTLTVSGNSVGMAAASTTSSGQDWTPVGEGQVYNAVAAGVLSTRLNMLYSGDYLFEYQYAPNGVPSGQCLADGDSNANVNDNIPPVYLPTLTVVLTQCGVTAASLWIVDGTNESNGYVDLINAGWESSYTYLASTASNADPINSPFAEPAVLTVNSSGKVVLAELSEIGQAVSPGQMWEDFVSSSQSSMAEKIAKASTVGS